MLRFSDFAEKEEMVLDGEKVRIDSILNKEIIIHAFKVRQSKFERGCNKCATVQFYEENDERKRIFFTGSSVIISMLEKYSDKLPFITMVKKIDKYYTFS
jgi:hypothetical protein